MKAKLTFKKSLIAAIKASAAAAVVNAILFYIFHTLGILSDDIFIQPGQNMTVVPVLISSILPTLIAGIVFFFIEKYTNNGFRIFSIVSAVLLIASFANPFMMIQGVTTSYALVLCVMHAIVVVALLFFIKSAVSTHK